MGLNRPIDITAEQRKTVLALLASHLPNTTAWVYGSRVKWTSGPKSDLDMVVFAGPEQSGRVSGLREAFEESNLPFRVDLFVWDDVSEQFRKQIEAEHVVLVGRSGEPFEGRSSLVLGDWVHYRLENCMAAIIDYRGKTPRKTRSGIPLITAKVVKSGRIKTPTEFIAIEDYDSWMRRGLPRMGDVLVTTEAPLGEVAQLDRQRVALAQRLILLRGKPGILNNRFLKFLMQSAPVQDQLRARASGTTVFGIKQRELRQIGILVPPIQEQRSIAHVLGTLDDKIELNRRMNQTLEAMARALFKSWFVDFDPVRAKATLKHHAATFPQRGGDWSVERARGYLDGMDPDIAALFPCSFVDSELGPIPEGWEVKDLGESFILTMGQSPPGSTYNEQGEGLPFFQGRSDFGFRYPENRKFCTAPTRIAQPGDSLVSVRAPVGDINMAWEKCCIGRGVAALRHKSGTISFSYYSAWTIQAALREYEQTGTVFGAINKSQFEALRVIEPSPSIVDAFASCARPLDAKIRSNIAESRIVAAFRDALLPKLVSGDVRAKQMEMTMP